MVIVKRLYWPEKRPKRPGARLFARRPRRNAERRRKAPHDELAGSFDRLGLAAASGGRRYGSVSRNETVCLKSSIGNPFRSGSHFRIAGPGVAGRPAPTASNQLDKRFPRVLRPLRELRVQQDKQGSVE